MDLAQNGCGYGVEMQDSAIKGTDRQGMRIETQQTRVRTDRSSIVEVQDSATKGTDRQESHSGGARQSSTVEVQNSATKSMDRQE